MAQLAGDQMTLGAYRLGGRMPWAMGAVVDLWAGCARGEGATGVPSPHVLFKRTRGDDQDPDRGSIYCPDCRVEMAAQRAAGPLPKPVTSAPPIHRPAVTTPPLDLPF